MPRIASPSASEHSATIAGSLKCVVARTIALARVSGSEDLKMPEPTKTASAPSCITRDASAGVAIPPAQKFGTGSLPFRATHLTSSSGAPSSFVLATISSSPSVVSSRISRVIALRCRTASTMFPEPASPFVRIIAAPSAILRNASPRLRAPHTNGAL